MCNLFAKRVLHVHQLLPVNVSRALFATSKWAEFIPSLMTQGYSKHPALCCFTASLVTSAVFGARGGGASFKIEMELHTHIPPRTKYVQHNMHVS